MRWTQGAKQGTIIVGGNGAGAGAEHLGVPVGLSFDRRGNLCVADQDNDRVQDFLSNKTYARKEQIIDGFNDTSTTIGILFYGLHSSQSIIHFKVEQSSSIKIIRTK
ncbi:unnamed protein product [Rotaria magnacalcarata]